MTNDKVRTQLSAYLDGELGEAERREVEATLAADATLRVELDQLRRTAELVRSLPRRAAPAGFASRVQAAITPAHSASRPWFRSWRSAAIAAAACLLLGLAALLMPRPDGGREVAKHITPIGQQPEATAKDDRAAAPVPATVHDLEGAVAETGKQVDKLEASRELLARTDDGMAASRARRNGMGHTAAPAAPAPTERPSFADAKDMTGGRGGANVPKPGIATPEETTAHAEGERAPSDKVRKELKLAGSKAAMPTATPPAVRSQVAPAVEALVEEAAKRDSGNNTMAKKGELRKAGEGGEPFADGTRRAADRQELMDAIEREYRFGQSTPHRALAPAAGGGVGNAKAGAGRIETRLAYTDLAGCLADWQAALDAANLVYAMRPVGGGEFVIETTLPAPEARALLARLAGPAKDKAQEKMEQSQTREFPEPQKMAAAALQGAQNAPAPMVHLVLHFTRAQGQADAEPAEQKK